MFAAAKIKLVGLCIIIKGFEKVCRLYFKGAADCHKPGNCTAVVVKVRTGLGQFVGLLLVFRRELVCLDYVVGWSGFKCESQLLGSVIEVCSRKNRKTKDFQVVRI